MEESLPMLIKRGLRAQLAMGSLITGQLIIEMDYHPDTPVKLVGLNKEYPEIPTIPSTFQRIYDTLKNLHLEETLKKITSAVSTFEEILKSPDIPAILHSANLTLADARKLINDVDSRVAPLADNANNTIKDARSLIGNMDAKLETLASKIAEGLEASHKAMDQARETLEALQSRLGKDSPLLNQLDNTLREFSEMARSIRSLANYLSRHPEALIRGKSGSQRR